MKLEVFKEVVAKLQEQDQILDRTYKAGIDIANLLDPIHSVVTHLIGSIYGDAGMDTFSWWCYEKEWGTRTDLTMTDVDGKLLCNTIEELHTYLESFKGSDYNLPKKLSDEERTEMLRNIFQ